MLMLKLIIFWKKFIDFFWEITYFKLTILSGPLNYLIECKRLIDLNQ